jgi:hypothetical protein
MAKFRSKVVEIEATCYVGTPEDNRRIIDWTRGSETPAHMGDMEGDHQTLYISTLEGDMRASPGDWIIRGLRGEHYPCNPDVFVAKYEPIA